MESNRKENLKIIEKLKTEAKKQAEILKEQVKAREKQKINKAKAKAEEEQKLMQRKQELVKLMCNNDRNELLGMALTLEDIVLIQTNQTEELVGLLDNVHYSEGLASYYIGNFQRDYKVKLFKIENKYIVAEVDNRYQSTTKVEDSFVFACGEYNPIEIVGLNTFIRFKDQGSKLNRLIDNEALKIAEQLSVQVTKTKDGKYKFEKNN